MLVQTMELSAPRPARALTMIELLVVMSIIAVLMGLLLPSLGRTRRLARQTECLAGLRQIGVAVFSYSLENGDSIPYGPKAPPPSATNFYPQTGNVTSLISLQSGAMVGLGLLLQNDLAQQKDLMFCPGADAKWDIETLLRDVGHTQVEGSYYYRHASVASLSGPLPEPRVKIGQLGNNSAGVPIRCLALDTQFISPPSMAFFNLKTRTHHGRQAVNALFTDGHASTFANDDDTYTVNLAMSAYGTLERILEVFEVLDRK